MTERFVKISSLEEEVALRGYIGIVTTPVLAVSTATSSLISATLVSIETLVEVLDDRSVSIKCTELVLYLQVQFILICLNI